VARRQRAGNRVAGSRGSRILGGGGAGRSTLIAIVSTLAFFGLIVLLVTSAPGWPAVREQFFDWDIFKESLREIAPKLLVNIKIFLIAEVFILIIGLTIAILRSLPGPVFFPVRLLMIVYTDFFRGVPTILVIYLFGFGVPALAISGVPRSEFVWGIVALTLVYSAYVSEVYRAGIESVHPSQEAAARSLGLTRSQALTAVVLPQAVRRVIPPLLNDFIGLQKDTALVGILGSVEAFKQSQIEVSADFNFTYYLVAATLFVAITIPLARFTDWLVARDRKRRLAGGIA
jgi:polar amino acid transport system permease protein